MSVASPESSTEELARLVRQKRGLLEQLVAAGQRQKALIDGGDTTGLLQLLSDKQRLITALREIEADLNKHRNEDPDARAWRSPQDRAACSADAEACNRLLAEVLESERQQTEEVASRRDAIASQLRQAQSAHVASAAYKPHLRGAKPAPAVSHESPSASIDLTTTG